MKRFYNLGALMIGLVVFISACSSTSAPPLAPAEDKLTFLFMYTEG